MNSEGAFYLKLGMLLGTLDDYFVRVEDGTVSQCDTDRVSALVKDVKIKLFQNHQMGWKDVKAGDKV